MAIASLIGKRSKVVKAKSFGTFAISLTTCATIAVTCHFLQDANYLKNRGEDVLYENSVTIYASDVSSGLSNGGVFSKGLLTFKSLYMETDGNKIVFKGLDEGGEAIANDPCLQVLTGSIPSNDGSLSGQGFTRVGIEGYDGDGYGLLGVNSYERAEGQGWIGYKQFVPKASQSIEPVTSNEKPIAKYVYVFGKKGYDLSITSITFYWQCGLSTPEPEEPEVIKEQFYGEPIITFNTSIDESGLYTALNSGTAGNQSITNWSNTNFLTSGGFGKLSLHDDAVSGDNFGANIKSTSTYQYGYFGGRLKALHKNGVVQTISVGSILDDEIEITILGKDTEKIQFNYYEDGVRHEYTHELGFDASLQYHDYGFKWTNSKIVFFIDNLSEYEVEVSLSGAGYINASIWASNAASYASFGEYVSINEQVSMYLDYLSYRTIDGISAISTTPAPGEIVAITDEPVSRYIKDFHKKGSKKANDYLLDINEVNTTSHTPRVSSYTNGSNLSKGRPVSVTFETALSGPYKVYLSTHSDFSGLKIVETNSKSVSFYNLNMATSYYVKVTNGAGTIESLVHKFTTEDSVRMIYTSLTCNIRDIGGKMTKSGKRIKQGLVYRGQELVPDAYTDSASGNHVKTIDSDSSNTLLNELGISLELDFRSKTELPDENNIVSPVGINYWNGTFVNSSGWVPAYSYITRDTNNLSMYRAIFRQFLNLDHEVIYFHCWGGLDRTGTVAFILEGLLGCSFTDMCIDYELSSFSGSGALRQRDVDYQSGGKGFKTMVTQMVNNTAGYNPNSTNDIQEVCENILKTAGITQDEINQIRNLLLED